MKVSIITAVYNGAATIEQAIQSVNRQTYPNIEHVIVDGCSTDGTMDIVKRDHDRPGPVVSEPDNGLYHAMNKGISMATGEVIGILNADDFYAHDRVIETIARTLDPEQVDGCYGDLVYIDSRNTDRVIRYWSSQPYRPGLFERGWMPAHPTFFVKSRVYRELGDFDLAYRYQSDFELTARFMAVAGIQTIYLPEVLVRMRMGGTTNRSLGNIWRGNLESYRACRKLGLAVNPTWFVTKFAMRIPQFFRRPRV